MKINFKDLIKAPVKEGYIKNSSTLVTGLFVIGGILYNLTKGYGTVVALGIALLVMVIQKILINQTNKYFQDMYQAKEMYKKTKNKEYLLFIKLCSDKMLKEIKVFSDKGKLELKELQDYANQHSVK